MKCTAATLSLVEFEINSMCNRKCSYCPNHQYNRANHEFMKPEIFRRCIDELAQMDFSGFIDYHFYGEPLLDVRLDEFVKYATHECPKARSIVFTNGDYLQVERFKSLVECGIYSIVVTRHCHTLNPGIKHLLSSLDQANRQKIRILFPEQIRMSNRAGAVASVRHEGDFSRNSCPRPSFEMIVAADGKVLPCCNDYFEKEVMGNVTTEGLTEIWNSQRFSRFRLDLLDGKRTAYALCKNCDWDEDKELTLTFLSGKGAFNSDGY